MIDRDLLLQFRKAISIKDKITINLLTPKLVDASEKELKKFAKEYPETPLQYGFVTNYGDVLEKLKKKGTREEGKEFLKIMQLLGEKLGFKVFDKIEEPQPGDIFYVVPYLTYQYHESWRDADGKLWWIVHRLGSDSGEKEKHRISPITKYIIGIHVDDCSYFLEFKHYLFFFND